MSTNAHALVSALSMAFAMGWEIWWPLILGFVLSGVVQAVVTKAEMSRLLPDSSPRSIVIETVLGAASSSCSYAAVALTRSIFRRGADFVAAMVFQFASTNLVLELGIILAVLIGWQFVAAEFVGGLIMVALLTVMLRAVMTPQRIAEAKRQADRGLAGRMEGHAATYFDLFEPERRAISIMLDQLRTDILAKDRLVARLQCRHEQRRGGRADG
jgi:uncharacterized membrane protein YraQ (UPF0718 family)